MRKLKLAQLKALSDFFNMIAAAWFSAGVISPFFTKPKPIIELAVFIAVGLLMSWMTMSWSLFLVEGIEL